MIIGTRLLCVLLSLTLLFGLNSANNMLISSWPPVLGAPNLDGQMRSLNLRLVFLCCAFALYLLLGAAVFSALEVPLVDEGWTQLDAAKQQLMASNPCLKGMCVCCASKKQKIVSIK